MNQAQLSFKAIYFYLFPILLATALPFYQLYFLLHRFRAMLQFIERLSRTTGKFALNGSYESTPKKMWRISYEHRTI